MNMHTYCRFFCVLLSAVIIFSFPAYSKTKKTYVSYADAAFDFFSKGQELYRLPRFHEAYQHFDQSIVSAQRALDFQGLKEQEIHKLKALIQEARNQKMRIVEITSNFQVLIKDKTIAKGMS